MIGFRDIYFFSYYTCKEIVLLLRVTIHKAIKIYNKKDIEKIDKNYKKSIKRLH